MGAFVTVFCLAWALQFGGLASMLAQVSAGVPFAVGWLIVGGCGGVLLVHGIFEALAHDDDFEAGSFLYSVGVIGLAVYGLTHQWYLSDGSAVQFSRALWFSWIASNAFNIWLQFRGRRHTAPPVVQEQRAPAGYLWRRLRTRQTRDWREEIYEDVQPLPDYQIAAPHIAPVLEHDGAAPQLGYVDRHGNFIPVQMPDAVPVNRRLR
jgi:hypothetical protein